MRRGCTVSSSFATGQGARALQQGRFMYEAKRDEMIAQGLAEFCTDVKDCARMMAKSLTRCGRFAVACSCVMVASTMSSLMPSRSTLGRAPASTLEAGVGEGGGVVSRITASDALSCDRFIRLLGCESGDCERRVEDEGRGDVVADLEAEADVEDAGDGRANALAAAARAALETGMCMPRLGSERDLRRVLYGMMCVCVCMCV